MTYLEEAGSSAPDRQPNEDLLDRLDWDDESQFVRARPKWFGVVRAVLAVLILGFIGLTIYRGAVSWFGAQLDPEGEPGEEVPVFIEAGATTSAIANVLEDAGVIPNSTFFRYYAQWNDAGNFQAGEYTMQADMSASEAIDRLSEGPRQIEYGEFVVPEGRWLIETLAIIAEQVPHLTVEQLLEALNSGYVQPRYRPEGNVSWEGLLFPAKYFIEEDITAEELLAKMSNEFASVTGELGYGAAEVTHGRSAYDVIIIASLIEAEARTEGDRAKIARVIYNRLEAGEPVGVDATLIYSKGVRGEPIYQSELDNLDDPYNTRRLPGLPPTPIAMPSRASLEAAMNPAPGPWMFYVLWDEEGNHKFAETNAEHKANSDDAKARGLFDEGG